MPGAKAGTATKPKPVAVPLPTQNKKELMVQNLLTLMAVSAIYYSGNNYENKDKYDEVLKVFVKLAKEFVARSGPFAIVDEDIIVPLEKITGFFKNARTTTITEYTGEDVWDTGMSARRLLTPAIELHGKEVKFKTLPDVTADGENRVEADLPENAKRDKTVLDKESQP
jgi:hypothetical protein